MISLNKFSFGPPNNFVNSYVTPDGSKVVVQVLDEDKVFPVIFVHEALLQYGDNYFVFTIPEQFKSDISFFLQGKFSRLSSDAKDNIKLYSGLEYRVERTDNNGQPVFNTDARILALDKDPLLKARLEWLLGVRLNNEDELMSPPSSIELWVEQEYEPV